MQRPAVSQLPHSNSTTEARRRGGYQGEGNLALRFASDPRLSAPIRGKSAFPLPRAHTTVIFFCNSAENRLLGIMACTPRTMSTTWVTRKLAAMLHNA